MTDKYYIWYEDETADEMIEAHGEQSFSSYEEALEEASAVGDGAYRIVDSSLKEVKRL